MPQRVWGCRYMQMWSVSSRNFYKPANQLGQPLAHCTLTDTFDSHSHPTNRLCCISPVLIAKVSDNRPNATSHNM